MSPERKIAVVGLGCVGLPAAVAFARQADRLEPADAAILALAHRSYVEGRWPLIQRLQSGGVRLVFDVKMKIDRGSKPDGIELLRL